MMLETDEKTRMMALVLFVIGVVGLLLFFYLAFILVTGTLIPQISGNPDQATSEFFTYLLRITLPLVTLLIVGGISLVLVTRGIELYSSKGK